MRARASIAGVLLLVLVACGGDGGSSGSVSMTTTTPARAGLSTSSMMTARGVYPITLGMTVDQARAAAGVPLELRAGPYCQTLTAPTVPGVHFTVTEDSGGKISLIGVTEPGVATEAGVRVGSSRTEVLDAYGRDNVTANERRITHPKVDYTAPFDPTADVLVFHTSSGRVTAMYAGAAALGDEYCA